MLLSPFFTPEGPSKVTNSRPATFTRLLLLLHESLCHGLCAPFSFPTPQVSTFSSEGFSPPLSPTSARQISTRLYFLTPAYNPNTFSTFSYPTLFNLECQPYWLDSPSILPSSFVNLIIFVEKFRGFALFSQTFAMPPSPGPGPRFFSGRPRCSSCSLLQLALYAPFSHLPVVF